MDKVYKVHNVFLQGNTLVVVGFPAGDEEHNCDAQGCAGNHVIRRVKLEPREVSSLALTEDKPHE